MTVSAGCPKCGGSMHRLSERFYRCDLAHLTPVVPPATTTDQKGADQ